MSVKFDIYLYVVRFITGRIELYFSMKNTIKQNLLMYRLLIYKNLYLVIM